ncbi:uncharacterized protein EV420DRAFT_933701 [Desarmillaria tabescens]|uniref:J domain-containing protein n=1 Tax=Armillaria tabescens TaxID=1929756 RepID=A0AA39NG54_ARMTA|nr:uncharacterized protein EV420DRAFT_933701 [Desarmillaria tabescens]KAK0465018.1 hypothetical protein EV420DRAFT_933701 [Desarmillaria tabescens]
MTSSKLAFLVTTMFSRLASSFTLRQASYNAAHHLKRPLHNTRPVLSPSTVSTLPSSCPACHQPLPSSLPACSSCGSITNIPSDINYYHLLGFDYVPSQFHVDQGLLRNQFRRAQIACHPDAWTSKGQVRFVHFLLFISHTLQGKTDVAQLLSSQINEAYQTLRDPLSRLTYLLTLNGVPMEETDKLDDMEFLSEIMLARNTIDDAEDEAEVLQVADECREKLKDAFKEISILVERGDWSAAKQAGIRLKYIRGVEKAAEEWLRDR